MHSYVMALMVVGASAVAVSGQAPAAPAKPMASVTRAHPADTRRHQVGPGRGAARGPDGRALGGDPSKPGFFTLRLKFPDGAKIPAHWHPTDENITVLQGLFRAGMGDVHKDTELHDFPAGSFIVMPKAMRHFASAKGRSSCRSTERARSS